MRFTFRFTGLALAAAAPAAAQGFGFSDYEIYRFQPGIRDLVAGDFDGDGDSDLALVNEARSRVEVLVRSPEGDPDDLGPDWDAEEANAVRFDGRYRRVPLHAERRVLHLAAGDLDGDGRAELVFAVEGGRVTVVDDPQDPAARRTGVGEVDELRAGVRLLRVADLDGDGRAEVLAAGDEGLLALALETPPPASGPRLSAPRVLDPLHEAPDGVFATDLDGDGKRDLLLAYHGSDRPFRWRLQQADGSFGPRFDADGAEIKSSAVGRLERGAAGEALLAVYNQSGRCALFMPRPARAPAPRLLRTSLPRREERAVRTYGIGDLDGDGTDDMAVADTAGAGLELFLGTRGRPTVRRIEAPTFVGARDPRVCDVDGDKRNELVLVSGPERMLGVARLAEGALGFPAGLPLDAEPVALDTADCDGDGDGDAFVVTASGEGRAREFTLQIMLGGPQGLVLAPERSRALKELKKEPSALRVRDLDRDGLLDCFFFLPGATEPPVILLQREQGLVPAAADAEVPGLGVLEGVSAAGVSFADADGDGAAELLAASRDFARAFSFSTAGGGFTPLVALQVHAPGAAAKIAGCTAADVDGDGRPEVVLRDERSGEALVFARGAGGAFELSARVPASGVGELGLAAADVDGDGSDEVLLMGEEGFGVLLARSLAPELEEVASCEPSKENLQLDGIAVGDLDADGRPDVALTELSEHALVLLEAEPRKLSRALGFKIFEDQAFGSSPDLREPREVLSADLTGDDKDDLAVLVHDKLIVYVQE